MEKEYIQYQIIMELQGTINFSDSLVRTVSRVEMRFVGQIDESKEKELAEEVEKIIKKFYL